MLSELMGIGVLVALVLLVAFGIQEQRKGSGIMGIVRIIYVVTITAFLIMFVTFGISAFYQPPESPKPVERLPVPVPVKVSPPERGTPEYEVEEWQAQQDRQQEEWQG